MWIDLNSDVGEGVGLEAELLPLVSSANVACGGHAGDGRTMAETMNLAKMLGVKVGAHPGFEDPNYFGRREVELSDQALQALVGGQLAALSEYGKFHYVKPHGALYNMAARDRRVAEAGVRAVKAFDSSLLVLGLADSELVKVAEARGLRVARELFADRGYADDGKLLPRGEAGALIEDETLAARQVLNMVRERRVLSVKVRWIPVEGDSVCLHGDNLKAVAFARRLRHELGTAGIGIRSFASAL
ncbi:MAG: LamB/YcsF family protein [Candidatus Synoicihabitans palmerolidicus]|nr:LamB/YcsF family protein [Candidatus Synoicihabitans palmerolidicus]